MAMAKFRPSRLSKSEQFLIKLELTELRFYVPTNTKQVISETFFPANLLA